MTSSLNYTNYRDHTYPLNRNYTPAFEIQSLDHLENLMGMRSDRFEMLWIKKGQGSLSVDGQHHIIGHDMIYCISPGHVRHFKLETENEGYYISFIPEF